MNYNSRMRRGVTLIELLLGIGLVAIITGTAFISMNAGAQTAKARNSERRSHLNAILVAIRSKTSDSRTGFSCGAGPIPSSVTPITSSGGYDLASCIVPRYLSALPMDPAAPTGVYYVSTTDYAIGYSIQKDPDTGRVILSAPNAELGEIIFAE